MTLAQAFARVCSEIADLAPILVCYTIAVAYCAFSEGKRHGK
jgi:hypothetical protein